MRIACSKTSTASGSPHEDSSNREGRDAASRYDSLGASLEALEETARVARRTREPRCSRGRGETQTPTACDSSARRDTAAADARLGRTLEVDGRGDDARHRIDARASPPVLRRAPSIAHPPRAAAMETCVRAR
jgi:hypothetical protein